MNINPPTPVCDVHHIEMELVWRMPYSYRFKCPVCKAEKVIIKGKVMSS